MEEQQIITAGEMADVGEVQAVPEQEQADSTHIADIAHISAPPQRQDYTPPLWQQDSLQAETDRQLQYYREREIDSMMQADLKAVQAVDPTVTSLADLPDTFLALRFNPVAPLGAAQAFLAAKAIHTQTQRPKPASAGSVQGVGAPVADYFTDSQLDRLTARMLDNPAVMEKALRSMARLK